MGEITSTDITKQQALELSSMLPEAENSDKTCLERLSISSLLDRSDG